MEDTLINFETAKLAKEKGFDFIYIIDNELTKHSLITQSLLAKWLREVHNCFIDILPHRDGNSKNKQWKSKKDVFWSVEVDYYGKNFEIKLTNNADFTQHFNKSYEEALEIGLYQALKLIK